MWKVSLEKFSVIICLQKVYINLELTIVLWGGKKNQTKNPNLSLFTPITQSPNCLKTKKYLKAGICDYIGHWEKPKPIVSNEGFQE